MPANVADDTRSAITPAAETRVAGEIRPDQTKRGVPASCSAHGHGHCQLCRPAWPRATELNVSNAAGIALVPAPCGFLEDHRAGTDFVSPPDFRPRRCAPTPWKCLRSLGSELVAATQQWSVEGALHPGSRRVSLPRAEAAIASLNLAGFGEREALAALCRNPVVHRLSRISCVSLLSLNEIPNSLALASLPSSLFRGALPISLAGTDAPMHEYSLPRRCPAARVSLQRPG
jgi:hypothetical protein